MGSIQILALLLMIVPATLSFQQSVLHLHHIGSMVSSLSEHPHVVLENNPMLLSLDTEGSTTSVFIKEVVGVIDAIKRASTSQDTEAAVSIAVAEAIAGGVGGLFSRRFAIAIGDIKEDSQGTKVLTTAAFFGVRGFSRVISRLAGLPRPLALVLSSLLASFAAEKTKEERRKIQGKEKISEEDEEEDESVKEIITAGEIIGDLTKWIAFDSFIEFVPETFTKDPGLKSLSFFAIGSVSAITGAAVRELISPRNDTQSTDEEKKKIVALKLGQASFEGGILFLIYKFVSDFLMVSLPEGFRIKFIFSQLMDEIEEEIETF